MAGTTCITVPLLMHPSRQQPRLPNSVATVLHTVAHHPAAATVQPASRDFHLPTLLPPLLLASILINDRFSASSLLPSIEIPFVWSTHYPAYSMQVHNHKAGCAADGVDVLLLTNLL